MKFFAVLGSQLGLCIKELKSRNLKIINQKENLVVLESNKDITDLLSKLGGAIKYGKVYKSIQDPKLTKLISNSSILGCETLKQAMTLKNKYNLKRVKEVPLKKTDLDIKRKGIEIINLPDEQIGVVQGYQNINFYTAVDFNKPVCSMNIGMMPSTLAHIMVSIGVGISSSNQTDKENYTVYDPFVGTGTTGFVTNFLGHNFIGSDINTSPSKQNYKRYKDTRFYKQKKFTIIKNDIQKPFSTNFLKSSDIICTEGYLGPIIKQRLGRNERQENWKNIWKLYKDMLNHTDEFWDNITVVFTIPVYVEYKNRILKNLQDYLKDSPYSLNFKSDIYQREGQKLGRQIVVLVK